jgi:multidrug resistance efflux pump
MSRICCLWICRLLAISLFLATTASAASGVAPGDRPFQEWQNGTVNAPANLVGDGYVDLSSCLTLLIGDVDVPAQESGRLVSVLVKDGQAVEDGQELALIDDGVARLQLLTAQTKLDAANDKAQSDIDIRAAQNALEIAERERKTNYTLYQKGSLPKQEYDRSALQAKQAQLQLEQAERDHQTAIKEAQVEQLHVETANNAIQRHRILSPLPGNVVETFRQAGEWVNAGDDVMRVARMDKLYVQGLLESQLHNPHEIHGKPVTVTAQLARGETVEFLGKIVFVAIEKNSTRYYSVRAEVENRQIDGHWLLLANEEVQMRIHLDGSRTAQLPSGNLYR